MLTDAMIERYLLATALTFGLLALFGWLAARYGGKAGPVFSRLSGKPDGKTARAFSFGSFLRRHGAPGTLRQEETVILTPQHQIHRVRDGQRVFLLATHPQGITLINSTLEAMRPHAQDDELPITRRR